MEQAEVRDYERVARAIEYLRRHAANQPDLTAVASHVHLSEYHFQRLFTRWAGVSPKRFLQFLTVEYAKARVAEARNVLDITAEIGMSSPGRLHDLFVTLEAMSPGEFRERGRGLNIHYGICDSPFGRCEIAWTVRGICGLRFKYAAADARPTRWLSAEWPNACIASDPDEAARLGRRVFGAFSSQPDQPLALLVKGTNFQIQVWRALLQVPFGSVTTYHDIAARIGHPEAARAVGGAIGRNPIAYLIPCHRVIRETGALSNYCWGENRKAAILGWEAARASASVR